MEVGSLTYLFSLPLRRGGIRGKRKKKRKGGGEKKEGGGLGEGGSPEASQESSCGYKGYQQREGRMIEAEG